LHAVFEHRVLELEEGGDAEQEQANQGQADQKLHARRKTQFGQNAHDRFLPEYFYWRSFRISRR
jgi:hypothetical protein